MALKCFCPSCGAVCEYTLVPPNFCGQCAKPLKSLSGAVAQASNTIKKAINKHSRPPIKASNDDDDDYTGPEVNIVPQLDKLDVDLDLSDSAGFKIGQIAASAKIGPITTRVDIPTNEQILKDFRKQASSSKGKESSEIS